MLDAIHEASTKPCFALQRRRVALRTETNLCIACHCSAQSNRSGCSSQIEMTQQSEHLSRRALFNPTIGPAIHGSRHEAVIDKLPAQQSIIAKQMMLIEDVVDLPLRERLPGLQPRPEYPQTWLLMAELAWPAHEACLTVKVPRNPLHLRVVNLHRDNGRILQALGRFMRGTKVLEVPKAGRTRQHVQQFDMSRLDFSISQLRVQ